MAESESRVIKLSDEDIEDLPPVEVDDSTDEDYRDTQEQPQDDDDNNVKDGDAMSLNKDDGFTEAVEYQNKYNHYKEDTPEPEINYIDEFPPKRFEIQVIPPTLEELGASLDDYRIPDPPKVIEILGELNQNGNLYYWARLKGQDVEKVCLV